MISDAHNSQPHSTAANLENSCGQSCCNWQTGSYWYGCFGMYKRCSLDDCIETVDWIGCIDDCTHTTVWFNQRVWALNNNRKRWMFFFFSFSKMCVQRYLWPHHHHVTLADSSDRRWVNLEYCMRKHIADVHPLLRHELLALRPEQQCLVPRIGVGPVIKLHNDMRRSSTPPQQQQ